MMPTSTCWSANMPPPASRASAPTARARCWQPFRGARAQLAQRHLRANPTARSGSPTPGTGACRISAWSGPATGLAGRVPHSARRAAGGEPQLMVDRYTFTQPNGLCFAPTRSRLYVNDTEQANIRVYDVGPGGKLRMAASSPAASRQPAARRAGRHEMRRRGQCLVHAPGGLWVYAPDGRHIGKVAIPELPANLHWGGPDWRTLYVCATTSVYAVPVKVGPRNEPFMRARPARRRGGQRRGARAAARCQPLRADHPGHAERRGDGGRRLRRRRAARSIAASRTPSPISRGWPTAAARWACR
jgi:hypothetical protein